MLPAQALHRAGACLGFLVVTASVGFGASPAFAQPAQDCQTYQDGHQRVCRGQSGADQGPGATTQPSTGSNDQSCGSSQVTYTTDQGTRREDTPSCAAPANTAPTAAPVPESTPASRSVATRATAAPTAASPSPSVSPLPSLTPLPTAVLGAIDTASPAELTDTEPQSGSSSGMILLILLVLIGGAGSLYFYLERRSRMSQFATPTPAMLGPFGPAPAGAMLPATENGYRFEPAPNVRRTTANGGGVYDEASTDVIVLPRPDSDWIPMSSPSVETNGYWPDVSLPEGQASTEHPTGPIVELRFVTDGDPIDPASDRPLYPVTTASGWPTSAE